MLMIVHPIIRSLQKPPLIKLNQMIRALPLLRKILCALATKSFPYALSAMGLIANMTSTADQCNFYLTLYSQQAVKYLGSPC